MTSLMERKRQGVHHRKLHEETYGKWGKLGMQMIAENRKEFVDHSAKVDLEARQHGKLTNGVRILSIGKAYLAIHIGWLAGYVSRELQEVHNFYIEKICKKGDCNPKTFYH